jgi:hypothetical protein
VATTDSEYIWPKEKYLAEKSYWQFEWSLFPVLDRRKIDAVYQSLWIPTHQPKSPMKLSIIYLCLALGCQYDVSLPLEEYQSTGQRFLAQAQATFAKLPYLPSLKMVHLLLLFGMYLQSSSHVFRCWMVVGEAIRMAQSLGLYLDQDVPGKSVYEREIHRRTWHGCVWLDR